MISVQFYHTETTEIVLMWYDFN